MFILIIEVRDSSYNLCVDQGKRRPKPRIARLSWCHGSRGPRGPGGGKCLARPVAAVPNPYLPTTARSTCAMVYWSNETYQKTWMHFCQEWTNGFDEANCLVRPANTTHMLPHTGLTWIGRARPNAKTRRDNYTSFPSGKTWLRNQRL
jgi:hypothetical protein